MVINGDDEATEPGLVQERLPLSREGIGVCGGNPPPCEDILSQAQVPPEVGGIDPGEGDGDEDTDQGGGCPQTGEGEVGFYGVLDRNGTNLSVAQGQSSAARLMVYRSLRFVAAARSNTDTFS